MAVEFGINFLIDWIYVMIRDKGVEYSTDGLYKPGCNNDEDDFRNWDYIRHFKFCPYCGKKIYIVN